MWSLMYFPVYSWFNRLQLLLAQAALLKLLSSLKDIQLVLCKRPIRKVLQHHWQGHPLGVVLHILKLPQVNISALARGQNCVRNAWPWLYFR